LEVPLYYTFSTIAQALASAIALLAAFVLFRLQSINAELERHASRFLGYYSKDRLRLDELHVAGDYEGLATLTTTALPADVEEGEVGFSRKRFAVIVTNARHVRHAFAVTLWFTVGVIAYSVVVLALAPFIAAHEACAITTFVIGISGLLWCLFSYVRLVHKVMT
jgi:hypothetical protein